MNVQNASLDLEATPGYLRGCVHFNLYHHGFYLLLLFKWVNDYYKIINSILDQLLCSIFWLIGIQGTFQGYFPNLHYAFYS